MGSLSGHMSAEQLVPSSDPPRDSAWDQQSDQRWDPQLGLSWDLQSDLWSDPLWDRQSDHESVMPSMGWPLVVPLGLQSKETHSVLPWGQQLEFAWVH